MLIFWNPSEPAHSKQAMSLFSPFPLLRGAGGAKTQGLFLIQHNLLYNLSSDSTSNCQFMRSSHEIAGRKGEI